MFLHVRDKLDMFEDKLESYLTHMNETGTLTPIILQVKELISVTKGKASHSHLPRSIHTARAGAWISFVCELICAFLGPLGQRAEADLSLPIEVSHFKLLYPVVVIKLTCQSNTGKKVYSGLKF